MCLALTCACGGEDAPVGPDSEELRPSTQVRRQAADRGIDWMVAHRRTMPVGWVLPFFSRLHRVVSDDDRAQQLWSIVEEDADSRRRELSDDLGDRRYLDDRFLRPVLREIRRRKLLGEPYRDDSARIQQLIRENENEFWSRRRLTQRIVYLDLFDEAGITTRRGFDDLLEEVRTLGDLDPERPDANHVYALTHLVLYQSGYFTRYPDPEPLAFAIPLLRRALDAYLSLPARHAPLDLQAEILICFQLLGVPENDAIRRAYARLLDQQNRDGSWERGGAATGRRVHATFTASVALLDLPERFRQTPRVAARGSTEPTRSHQSGRQPGSDSPSGNSLERPPSDEEI